MAGQFKRIVGAALLLVILSSCRHQLLTDQQFSASAYNLRFPALAGSWDEAIPLGNGMLGALVWKREGKLRISLDRADLWDLRPAANQDKPEWRFSWVKEKWEKDQYQDVQELFDVPYDRDPGPSKIPAGALEFDIGPLGEIESVELKLDLALCEVKWKNGASLKVFINAEILAGWFQFQGLKAGIIPEFISPPYNTEGLPTDSNPVTGQDLRRLGYPKGKIIKNDGSLTFEQEGWGGFRYLVNARWKAGMDKMEGCWSISSEFPGWDKQESAEKLTEMAMKDGFSDQLEKHQVWWGNFWAQSGISLPDSVLTKQWYLEMYKLGAATGNGAPPISLQAVWTADNGKLPPWKGDFHHDLNTQLSYWPAYSSNHLEQEAGFLEWLQRNKQEFEKYTRTYYETSGLNVPGVSTLTGQPMGGWIQYSFGPTVSAWLGQHFYLHWRYSMDRDFLEKQAYPWIKAVATHLEELSVPGENGSRKLPLSSSPEIFDNSREAWFPAMTNFDLALVRWTFEKAGELATELGKQEEAGKWYALLAKWPEFDIDPISGLTFARGFPYSSSHRHFSHLMAIHPLGIIDWSNGEKDQQVIRTTISTLDKYGSDWWTGYSFSWLGNLKARAFDGNGAAEALRIFADDFCLENSFHVNGDQSGTGKSKFTYRPFTLEGNFAFAAGIQEMLIQSHTGIIHIFPAVPEDWKDISYHQLRAEGAFLVSARQINGEVEEVDVLSEKGGVMRIQDPFQGKEFKCNFSYNQDKNIIVIETEPGQQIRFSRSLGKI